jgi:hypothetical protein
VLPGLAHFGQEARPDQARQDAWARLAPGFVVAARRAAARARGAFRKRDLERERVTGVVRFERALDRGEWIERRVAAEGDVVGSVAPRVTAGAQVIEDHHGEKSPCAFDERALGVVVAVVSAVASAVEFQGAL